MAIANPQQKKSFAGMFSSRSRRRDSETQMHPSLARRKGEEQDFDRMLMARSTTKKVSLGQAKESSSIWHREPPVSPIKIPLPPSRNASGQSTPTQAMVRKRTKSSNNRPSCHYRWYDECIPVSRVFAVAVLLLSSHPSVAIREVRRSNNVATKPA